LSIKHTLKLFNGYSCVTKQLMTDVLEEQQLLVFPAHTKPGYTHSVSEKTRDCICSNNLSNLCSITIIFGTLSCQTVLRRKIVSFPSSP